MDVVGRWRNDLYVIDTIARSERTREVMSTRAKLFWNGRSQAVRLPKEFRFSGDEVLIRRANEKIILEPVQKGWDAAFWACFGKLSDDVCREVFVAGDAREDAFS